MRLLLDHNLSPRLVDRLADVYPGSSHVFRVGLDRALDLDVWQEEIVAFGSDPDLGVLEFS